MQLPIATATTAAERTARARRTRLAIRAGLLTAGALLAVLLVAPVPRWCLDLVGAPRVGLARFGGLRVGWLAHEAHADPADLQRRLASRGITATLRGQGSLVTVEIPGMREVDAPPVLALLRGPGAVEIHELGPGGALEGRVLFDQAQIQEAMVTSHIIGDTGDPTVTFMLWTPDPLRGRRLCSVRVAITVDHDVRWTARLCKLLGDLIVLDDVDRGDLAGLAAALDGGALHGGAVVYAAYAPPADLAAFAWAARAAVAIAGGGAVVLISLLPSARSGRPRRRHDANAIAGMHRGAGRRARRSRFLWRRVDRRGPRSSPC